VNGKNSSRCLDFHPLLSEIGKEIAHYEKKIRKREALIRLCNQALEKMRRSVLEKGPPTDEEPGISIIMQFIGTISEERSEHRQALDRLTKEISRLQDRLSNP